MAAGSNEQLFADVIAPAKTARCVCVVIFAVIQGSQNYVLCLQFEDEINQFLRQVCGMQEMARLMGHIVACIRLRATHGHTRAMLQRQQSILQGLQENKVVGH